MKPLSPRQQKFCRAYAQTGVGEAAAIAAGYARKSARAQASRLLTNANIGAELARLAEATESEAVATLQDLRTTWSAIIRNESESMPNRLRASELLGRSLGAFIECREHSGPNGAPLTPTVNLVLTHRNEKDVFQQ